MSQLLKIENNCEICSKTYILVIETEDLNDISCCPFCASSISLEDVPEESE